MKQALIELREWMIKHDALLLGVPSAAVMITIGGIDQNTVVLDVDSKDDALSQLNYIIENIPS